MRLYQKILNQLYFHKKERQAFLVLLCSIFMVYVIQYFIAQKDYQKQTETVSRISYIEKEIVDKKVNIPRKKISKKQVKKYKPKPLIISSFNPNLISKTELLDMGLPYYGVLNLLKYRKKGGVFKVKDDLRKIYGLDTIFHKIEPWIELPDTIMIPRKNVPFIKHFNPKAKSNKPEKYVQEILDINSATIEEFKSLKGIGDVLSDRIIKYRNRLGGFISVDQISEVYFLPDSVFILNRPYFKIETDSIRKIPLNTADFTTLNAHPLISYKQAQLILAYRKQHVAYKQIEEIQNIKAFDGGFVEKILPYLTL